VLGFEADIQRGSDTFTAPLSGTVCHGLVALRGGANWIPIPPLPLKGAAVTSQEAKIQWFGTVRGRVGMLISNGLLLYGTGGLAYGHVSVLGDVTVSATSSQVSFGPTTSTFSQSKTNVGFAAARYL
jgi:outer membrane immunogenic protein